MASSTDSYGSTAGAEAQAADEALQQTTQQALALITDSLNTAKEQACKLWEDVRPQLDRVANYAKEEPTKSVLMAVVAGALLVTVATASRRSSKPVDVAASKKWLKALAADAADRAQSRADDARDAAESAGKQARKTLADYAAEALEEYKSRKDSAVESARALKDDAVESARRAASSAYDNVSDRLQDLRGKADPLIEQIQPQLDNVAGYAKKNPLSALVVAIAAGALLSRLTK